MSASWWRAAPAAAALAWGGNQFTPLLTLYREQQGYAAVEVNVLLAMYVVGLVPAFLVAGRLSDRYGARSVMLTGLLVGVVASLALAMGAASQAALAAGRVLAGAGVAVGMVVGTRWIVELSGPTTPRPITAQRAAGTLTLGFGAGAGVAGTLAQWAPFPTVLPYAVHVALSAIAALVLLPAPDTGGGGHAAPAQRGRQLPAATRRRLLLVVLPSAPWVFATAGLAYALVPELVASRAGSLAIGFATLLTVVTLGVGAAVQRGVPALHRWTHGHEATVGMALVSVGILLVRWQVAHPSLALALCSATVLGAAYGITVVAGLIEVRHVASMDDVPDLTAVFYGLTYVGFALPAVLAGLRPLVSYADSLLLLALLCGTCVGLVARGLSTTRLSLPSPGPQTQP